MAVTPAHSDIRDQHITDLRDALTRVIPLLAFSAGQLAADEPEYAAGLVARAQELGVVLARTAPE